jgi:hypothetical protein
MLAGGVLDIGLSAANDAATISVVGTNIDVFDGTTHTDFAATSVHAINAHGNRSANQAVSFNGAVTLTGPLTITGLTNATLAGTYTAATAELGGTDSFTLSGPGILSTRTIAAGADPRTAPSLGNSGDITIDARAITINNNARLLANVEQGSAFKPGAIKLDAADTAIRQTTQFLPVFVAAKTASISLDHATIDGGEVKIKTEAADKNLYDGLGSYVDKLVQNAFNLLDSVPQFLTPIISSGVTGISAQVSVRASQASIASTDSEITGTGVDIGADALANSSFHTVSITSVLNSGFTMAIGYGQAQSTAMVSLAGTTITSDDTVKIDSKADSDAEIKAIGIANAFNVLPANRSAVAISVAVGNTKETSHVTISQDSTIISKHGAVDVAADGGVKNFDWAQPSVYQDGAGGIGVAVSIDNADIQAQVNGKIDAFGGSTVLFAPSGVSTSGDTITLPSLPFAENDAVVYHAPANGTAVGGLTDGNSYYVHVVDPSTDTIQLVGALGIPLDNSQVNPASTHTISRIATKPFDSSAVNAQNSTITISGFSDGQLVTYIGNSNDPNDNSSRGIPGLQQGHQYQVHLASSGTITLTDPSASDPLATVHFAGTGRGGQLFVYSDDVQSFMPATAVDSTAGTIHLPSHGLKTGDPIIYATDPNRRGSPQTLNFLTSDGQGGYTSQPLGTVTDLDAPISGLSNGQLYYVVKLDDNTIRLAPTREAALQAAPVVLTSGGTGTQALQAADEADGISIHAVLRATNMSTNVGSHADEALGFPALIQDGPVNAAVLVAGLANLGAAIPGSIGEQLKGTPLEGESSPIGAAASIAIVSVNHTVVADVGPTAQLTSNNDVSVGAEITEYCQTFATAEASKPEDSQAVLAVAAGIGIGIYKNTAHATVEGGARIDAGNTVKVESNVNYPFLVSSPLQAINPADYLLNSGPEGWAFFMDGTLGLASNLFNSWVTSQASSAQVSVGGSLSVTIYTNESIAKIGAGAQVNQNTDSRFRTGNQSVEVIANTAMHLIEIAGVGGLGFNLEGGVEAFHHFKGGRVIQGIGELVNPFGAVGEVENGIGASLLVNVTTNNTQALVDNGAAIFTGPATLKPEDERGLMVAATQDIFNFALAEAGTSGSDFSVAGSITVGVANTTTVANVASGALVAGEALHVVANDNLERISIAGAVVSGEAVGVGLSVGINVINRDTEAYFGNSRDQTAGTAGTSIHLDGPLDVAATSTGELWAFSLAGLFLNNPDLPEDPVREPGFIGPLPAPLMPDETGIGIAGAAGVNMITEVTAAYINDQGTVDVHQIDISADDATRLVAANGGLALANQTGATDSGMFAGALGFNSLTATTLAFISGPEIKVRSDPGDTGDKLTLKATREGDVIAAGAGIGAQVVGGNAITVAGSVGINEITDDTEAWLANVNTMRTLNPGEFDVEGAATLTASDTSSILSIGGGLAITISPFMRDSSLTLTLGVAGTGNVIDNTIKAFMDHSNLKAEGNVELTADSAPTISAFTFAGSVTAQSGGLGGDGFAGTGAGATSINQINSTVWARLEANSDVETDGSIGLAATDASQVTANAGGFGISLSLVGDSSVDVAIGASFAENQITNDVQAVIDTSTASAGQNVALTATSNGAAIHALTIGASLAVDIGNREGILGSGAGALSFNIIRNTVETAVNGGSSVTTTNGDVTLTASDDSTIEAQAWGFGFGLTVSQNVAVSMGFGITLNDIGNVIRSNVDSSTVSAGHAIALDASSTPTITSLEVAAAISANFNTSNVSAAVAAAGAGGKNTISNTIESSITGGSSITSRNSGDVDVQAVDNAGITATATAVVVTASTSDVFAAAVSLSGTYAENDITDQTHAFIDGVAVNSAGTVGVAAVSTSTIDATLVAVSASVAATFSEVPISVAIAAASSTANNNVGGSTSAYIQGASNVIAGGDIAVTADNSETKVSSEVVSVAVSAATIGVAIGVSLAENSISNDATAYIDAKATSTGGNVHVSANSVSTIEQTHAVAVAASLNGFSGSGGHADADVGGSTEAYLGANANITAAQGTVSVSSTSASTANVLTETVGVNLTATVSIFLAEATISRATLAHVNEGATVNASALSVQADATRMDADVKETLGSAGLAFGLGVATSNVTVNGNVEAYVGNQDGSTPNGLVTQIDTTGPVFIHASADEITANSSAMGGSGSVVLSASAMVANATVAGSTKAYVGYLGDPNNGAHLNSDELDVQAIDGASAANASTLVVSVALGVSGAGSGADAEVTRDVKSFIAGQDVVNAHNGAVTVDAISNGIATADSHGGAGAILASIAAIVVNSHVGGLTSASIGTGTMIHAGSLEVAANAVQSEADATSQVVNVSIYYGLSASRTTSAVDGNITSSIGDGSMLNVTGAVAVNATSTPHASASAFGLNIAGEGSVGATIASATVGGMTTSDLGNNVVISAASLTVDAQRSTSTQSSATGGSGGVLIGTQATQSTASTDGTVLATTGTGVFLPDGDVTIEAISKSNQAPSSTGVAVGGVLAVGLDESDADSAVTTVAQLGAGAMTHDTRGGNLTVLATGTDTNDPAAIGGSGGFVAVDAAIGKTTDNSTVTAALGGALSPGVVPVIHAGTVTVHAVNQSVFTPDVNSLDVAFVGASGAVANNSDNTSANAMVESGTVLIASFAVNITSQNNFVEPDPSDGSTVSAGAGDFVGGSAAVSDTTLNGTSNVSIGSSVVISVETPTVSPQGSPGIFLIASSDLTTYDLVTLSAGGAIQGAGTQSSLTATLNDNVVINSTTAAPDVFMTNQNIGIGTYTSVDAFNASTASTIGLGAVADAIAGVTVTANHTVMLGQGANLMADDNINITAGDNPLPGVIAASPMLGDANAQSYARGFVGIPIASASSTLASNATLTIDANDEIQSGENTILAADPGSPTPEAEGVAHGYELFFIPATGGSSTPLGSTSSNMIVDGTVTAGALHELNITIPNDNSAGAGYSSTITVNTDGAPYSAFTHNFTSSFNPYTTIQNAAAHGAFSNPSAVMTLLDSVFNGPVGAMVLGPLFASGGDVSVKAGTLQGSGTLKAYGGPTINVTNYSPDYLVLGSINIPDAPGGDVAFRGGASAPGSMQIDRIGTGARPVVNIQELYNQAVPASGGNTNGPAVFLTSAIDSQGNVVLDPNGAVNNLAGQVAITVANGSLVEVGSLNAAQLNISVLKGVFAVSNPNGVTSTGLSAFGGWDPIMFWPGGFDPYTQPLSNPSAAARLYSAFVANALFNARGQFGTNPANIGADGSFTQALMGFAGETPLSLDPGNGTFPSNPTSSFQFRAPATSVVFIGADAPWLIVAGPQDTNASASLLSPVNNYYVISNSANDGGIGDDAEGIFPMIPVEPLPTIGASFSSQQTGGSSINAGEVFITAQYVDVDGPVNVGHPNQWSVSLPSSLNTTIALDQAAHAQGIPSGNPADPKGFYTLPAPAIGAGDTAIPVQFDAITNQVVVSNVSAASGGFIMLDGAIMSTSTLGKINVNSDLGQVNINNQTNFPIVVQNVSASKTTTTPSLSGVDIIDHNRPAASEQRLWVYHPDNTISLFEGTSSESVQQLEQGSPVQVISGNQTSYSPYSGVRWEWQLQTTIERPQLNPGDISTAAWSFDIAVKDNSAHQNLSQNPWYYLTTLDGHIQQDSTTNPTGFIVLGTPGEPDFQETISGAVTAFYIPPLQPDFTIDYHDMHYGFVPPASGGSVDPWTYFYPTQAELTLTDSVKADNMIGIQFSGASRAAINITSGTPVILEGNIANPLGDTSISALSISQTSSATITSNNLTLDSALVGGVGAVSQPVNASLTDGGVLNVQAGSGGAHVNLNSGAVLGSVIANNGDLAVSATQSLVAGSGTSIIGNNVTLTSSQGAVGTAAAPLFIFVSGVLNVTAFGDIGLRQGLGTVLQVGQICSVTGDVTLNVRLGSIVNGHNPAVIAFQNEVNTTYAAYWQLLSNGVIQNGQFTLNPQAAALYSGPASIALNITNPTVGQIQIYAAILYSQYVGFFGLVFGASWMSLPQFQSFDPSFRYLATAAQIANLGSSNAYWSLLPDPLAQVALNPSDGTPVETPTPNVCGHNVTLIAGNTTIPSIGNIGQSGTPMNIPLADLQSGHLTAAQEVALADAITTADIVYTYTNGVVTGIHISGTVQLFVAATGVLNARATGSVTIQSTAQKITLGQVTAGGPANITAPDSILSSGSGTQIMTPSDTVLKVETGTVGSPTTFLNVGIGGQLSVYTPPGNAYLTGSYNLNIATILTVSASVSPVTYGESVTFAATISDRAGTGAPTGTVEFFDGTTDLGHGTALQAGGNSATSTFTTSTLAARVHQAIVAVYTPTGHFVSSEGSTSLAVNPAALTITAISMSKTYGQTVTLTGTAFTEMGLVNGDTVTAVTETSAGASATATVGTYSIIVSAAVGTGLSNYTISYVSGTLTVNPAALTITANSASKTYGQTVAFSSTSFAELGLVNGDTVTAVTETSAGAPATAAVGTYSIVASAAVGTGLSNYTIRYVSGTLTVNPAALIVTAVNESKIYGTTFTPNGATQFTTLGLLNNDVVTSVSLNSSGYPASATVGIYPILATAAVGPGVTNYTIIYVSGTLTVIPAALTVTAANESKIYGTTFTPNGNTQFTTQGLANGNSVTSVTLNSRGFAATASVGTYPIVAAAAVGTGLSNYTINYVSGTLTVNPAALTVTASNETKVYGTTIIPNWHPQFTTQGLLNGDTVGSVTLSCSGFAATATVTAPGPTYVITASAAVGSGVRNYTIRYVTGTLTITPAALTITAYDESKIYGTTFMPNGRTQFASQGLANRDSVTIVSLTSSGYAATATVTAPGPVYAIVASAAMGSGLGNYNIRYVSAMLTISRALLTITAANESKIYGTTFTPNGRTQFTTLGLVNSDNVTSVVLTSSGYAPTATVTWPGPFYPIFISGAQGSGLGNYIIHYISGTLTIHPATLRITADSTSKVYGRTMTFAPTAFRETGLVVANGDSITGVTETSLGTPAPAPVGTYFIRAGGATGARLRNYIITYMFGTLTVERSAIAPPGNHVQASAAPPQVGVANRSSDQSGTWAARAAVLAQWMLTTANLPSRRADRTGEAMPADSLLSSLLTRDTFTSDALFSLWGRWLVSEPSKRA